MYKQVKRKRLLAAVGLASVLLACLLVGCQAQENQGSDESTTPPASNDTAVKGEYDAFDPNKEAEVIGGEEIEGSEEEKLQQERIAGGAVGGVQSQNLEPLEGITDSSEGDYTPDYGINLQAPAIGHGDNGSDCLSCHGSGGQGTVQPKSHIDSQLANEDCGSCHSAQG